MRFFKLTLTLFLIILLPSLAFAACFDDDDDDTGDDDTGDDDAEDDDTGDDDTGDDDTGDDDTGDDDTGDDDTGDDDTGDDDTGDDDTGDDDTGDDDTGDDDTGDDEPNFERVYGNSFLNLDTSLALGPTGQPYYAVSVGGEATVYTKDKLNGWTAQFVDNQANWPRVTLDAAGSLHLVYQKDLEKSLRYATNKSGGWVVETIYEEAEILDDRYGSIRVDGAGVVHVGFYAYEPAEAVMYATRQADSWMIDPVASTYPTDVYVDLGPDDSVHMTYRQKGNDGGLVYATQQADGWNIDIFAPAWGVGHPALDIDDQGAAHVGYVYYGEPYVINYATNKSGVWNIEELDNDQDKAYYGGAFAADSLGYVHLSYQVYEYESFYFRYATNNADGWTIVNPDTSWYNGYASSLAIDQADKVHIGYLELDNHDELRYATNQSGSWSAEVIDESFVGGSCNSLALDGEGYEHVSFLGGHGYDLMYANNLGGSWSFETIDEGIYNLSSIALDYDERPHVGYTTIRTKQILRYAFKSDSSWTIEVIDDDNSGDYPSLALDAYDAAHLSYYGNPEGTGLHQLKYATNRADGWVVEVVDTGVGRFYWTSLALDSSGQPHISYCDGSTEDLMYAFKRKEVWTVQTIDSENSVGYFSSLALDDNDHAHISYNLYYLGDLKYATNASGAWQWQTIDATINRSEGLYTSLILDDEDHVLISYAQWYSATDEYWLRYINNIGGTWNSGTIDYLGLAFGRYSAIGLDRDDRVHIAYYGRRTLWSVDFPKTYVFE